MREEHSWIKDIIPVTKTVGLCSAAILSIIRSSGNWVRIIIPFSIPHSLNRANPIWRVVEEGEAEVEDLLLMCHSLDLAAEKPFLLPYCNLLHYIQ